MERLPDLIEQDGCAVSRRGLLRFALAGSLTAMAGSSLLVPFRYALGKDGPGKKGAKDEPEKEVHRATGAPAKAKAVIFLYMAGGPSHIDTFDPKPGRDTNGPYKQVALDGGAGMISEHLPLVAKQGKRLSIVRSMTSKEGSHDRARFLMITGYRPTGPVEYPSLGAIMAKEHPRPDEFDLPQNIEIGGGAGGPGGGFLGARFAPFLVGDPTKPVQDLSTPPTIDDERFARRQKLLDSIEKQFEDDRGNGRLGETHREVYHKAERLLKSPLAKVFDVTTEPENVRQAYGGSRFGNGCLLARRLVETGVPFVEVTLGGWDTHKMNFEQVEKLSKDLDPAMATLIQDLADRNLLDSTMVVWGGEFGRTPKIRDGGRDHHPKAFSMVLAGGGIGGGRVIGASDADGDAVKDRPVSVGDIHATIAQLAAHDPDKMNESGLGRPIRIVDKEARAVKELLA